MKASLPLGLGLVLVAGTLSGCGLSKQLGDARGGWNSEQEAAEVSSAMASAPTVIDEGMFDSDDDTEMTLESATGRIRPEAPIHPLTFWRRVLSVERHFDIAFSDSDSTGRPTTVLVTLHKTLRGSFNILTGDSIPHDVPRDSLENRIVHKAMAEEWTRRALLHRLPVGATDPMESEGDGHLTEWRLVAWSPVKVKSVDHESAGTHIVSVHVQTTGWDTTLTDPLALIPRRSAPRLDAGVDVTLTVTTEQPDDVVVLMHPAARFRLHANGDNTYTGTWRAPFEAGWRHVALAAASHGTLFDDTAPYSAEAWLVHYGVRGSGPEAGLHRQ